MFVYSLNASLMFTRCILGQAFGSTTLEDRNKQLLKSDENVNQQRIKCLGARASRQKKALLIYQNYFQSDIFISYGSVLVEAILQQFKNIAEFLKTFFNH